MFSRVQIGPVLGSTLFWGTKPVTWTPWCARWPMPTSCPRWGFYQCRVFVLRFDFWLALCFSFRWVRVGCLPSLSWISVSRTSCYVQTTSSCCDRLGYLQSFCCSGTSWTCGHCRELTACGWRWSTTTFCPGIHKILPESSQVTRLSALIFKEPVSVLQFRQPPGGGGCRGDRPSPIRKRTLTVLFCYRGDSGILCNASNWTHHEESSRNPRPAGRSATLR